MQLPLFQPSSTWLPPAELPILRGVLVAVDTETCDPSLSIGRGPGWPYENGYICGVSAAWSGGSIYVPTRHPDTDNYPSERVRDWVRELFVHNEIVFQNAPYDLGWLGTWGIVPPERFHDTILAAVMIDENRFSYALDALCKWQGIKGKDEAKLKEAAAIFGIDPKKELFKLPARFVGEYAEQDAVATLNLFLKLRPQLEQQKVVEAYELDRDLIPMVIEMRRRGIRIDMDYAERLASDAEASRDEVLAELSTRITIGRKVTIHDVGSPKFLAQVFTAEGIHFPRTPKTGQGSFKSEWMERTNHWLPQLIVKAHRRQEIASKFLREYILSFTHRGRLHAEIHSFRGEEGGTRSHRFAYSSPPLQQMPARTDEGRLIRECFLPEQDELWCSTDYSQQEPRLTVHYAKRCNVLGADEAVAYYRHHPDPDYHQMVSDMFGRPRKKAKIINLGLAYGQGASSLAEDLDLSKEECDALLKEYHDKVPFVGGLTKYARSQADAKGFVRLIDGARCRFDLWEPSWRDDGDGYVQPMRLEAAKEKWPNRRLRRAMTHKAMNRLIQGSAARQTKKAMREMWRQKIVPLLQMHDELCNSIATQATADLVADIMINVIKLEVPVKVDAKIGPNWGRAKEDRRPGSVTRYLARAKALGRSAGSAVAA